jgi:hypothetical protein
MKTDTVLRCDGMRILTENLGMVEAERFITLILREPFDYTKWRESLFDGIPLDDFLKNAMEYRTRIDTNNH